MADLHDSNEHYLMAIYEIDEEGVAVIRARIARRLNISAPSVSEHINRMESQKLVKINEKNIISLTKSGHKIAVGIVRRHRLAECLLVSYIGLDKNDAHKEADRLEHAISEKVEKKLAEVLGFPTHSPDGKIIPVN
ncbi:MAG: metal-dependent transcriptional regulator [Acidimicrobiia bacterium]|nr:metal-dependent transcriptional regulator [Acidimicrobiia bacterium]